ncbi:MAG: hypothetical protein KMY54_06095, partial [Erysipelothrix sp.]|nr:hypothetical protein [Erysipelothrix sp.]
LNFSNFEIATSARPLTVSLIKPSLNIIKFSVNNEEKSLEEEKVKLMEPFYPKNFHRKKWKGSI